MTSIGTDGAVSSLSLYLLTVHELDNQSRDTGLPKSTISEVLNGESGVWAALLNARQPAAKARVVQALHHWQQDSDLAAIRDADNLAKLDEAERAACR